MDNTDDPTVVFNDKGRCSYCIQTYKEMPAVYFPNDEGKRRLDALLAKVREEGRKKKYDCIIDGAQSGNCYKVRDYHTH